MNEVVELNRINLEYSSKLEELVEERTAQLRENEFRLRGFMDSATDAFFIYDSDLKLLDLNPAALSLYARGTKREDLIGRKMIEVAHGIEKTARYEVYKRTLKTGEPYYENDFPVIPSLGEGWASIRAFKMGENLGIIWRDTTARVMAEARLKESEAKLRLFMDSANDGFAIYDKDLNLVEVNNVVVARFPSMSREEVLGRNITELYPGIEDTVFYSAYRMVLETGEPWRGEGLYGVAILKDVILDVSAFKVGEGLGVISRDVTKKLSIILFETISHI